MDAVNNLRAALHPKILELIIFPTEKCNFRCTYCYETFEVGKMKRPVIEGIKNLIQARIERHSLEHLVFSWFGGEPTLALDVITEISQFGKQMYDEGKIKVFGGYLTTNGYLLKEPTLRELVGLHQRGYQISLDGYGEGHDVTRRYINGKGTFSRIWENLVAAHETTLDFDVTLRLHQTAENGDSMRKLVSEIRSHFKGDKRFSVFFKTIENLGGPNAATLQKMKVESARDRVRDLAAQLKGDGFAVSAVLDGPESSRGDLEPPPPKMVEAKAAEEAARPVAGVREPLKGYGGYICYASKPNSLMIRADGGIGKCTVALDSPLNNVGRLKPDGTVELNNDLMKIWMRGFNSFDPLELGCPAQNLPKQSGAVVEKPIKLVDMIGKKVAAAAPEEALAVK